MLTFHMINIQCIQKHPNLFPPSPRTDQCPYRENIPYSLLGQIWPKVISKKGCENKFIFCSLSKLLIDMVDLLLCGREYWQYISSVSDRHSGDNYDTKNITPLILKRKKTIIKVFPFT